MRAPTVVVHLATVCTGGESSATWETTNPHANSVVLTAASRRTTVDVNASEASTKRVRLQMSWSQDFLAIKDATEQAASRADDTRWERSDHSSTTVAGCLMDDKWTTIQECRPGGCLMDIGSVLSAAATIVALGLEALRASSQEKDALDKNKKNMAGQEATINRLRAQVKGLFTDKKIVKDECRCQAKFVTKT